VGHGHLALSGRSEQVDGRLDVTAQGLDEAVAGRLGFRVRQLRPPSPARDSAQSGFWGQEHAAAHGTAQERSTDGLAQKRPANETREVAQLVVVAPY
jgi:hypothetical protein